jgi:hypothetical protein
VWLALEPSRLWVNLHPGEPHRIIDPELGRTDAGRVLLEADLRMKKTVAKLIHPDSRLGTRFWDSVRDTGAGSCLSFRQWIVPAPATVREDGGGLYIVDAPLSVKLETEYLSAKGTAGGDTGCKRADTATEEHNERVFRTMILPEVEKAVNQAPEYAALRRVYLTRIAAEWYRQRSRTKATALRDVIDSGSTARWPARTPWDPRDVFDKFVKSVKDGEFRVERTTVDGGVEWTTTYIYGGVDFGTSPRAAMSAAHFTAKHPDLPGTVSDARQAAILDDQVVWLGGESADRAEAGAGTERNTFVRRLMVPIVATVAALIVAGVAVAVTVLVFGKRPRRRLPQR